MKISNEEAIELSREEVLSSMGTSNRKKKSVSYGEDVPNETIDPPPPKPKHKKQVSRKAKDL